MKSLSTLLPALLLALAAHAASAADVRHLELNGAHLIDTGPNNYAISAPSFQQNQWKTVSVNGNNVVILSANCQSTLKTLQSLTPAMSQLIETARNELLAVENGQQAVPTTGQQVKFGSSRYSLVPGANSMYSSRGMNVNFSSFNNNGMSIVRTDENNFSASKQGMPNNLGRVFVNNDLATYVYLNGEVQMKPVSCLQPAEVQLNQQLKAEAQQAEQQFKEGMNRMQQNMQNMQQNMQQSMQNMQNNMQNMFGNGFPFNNMMSNGNNNMMSNGNNMMMSNGNNMMSNGYMPQQQQSYNNMQNGYNSNYPPNQQAGNRYNSNGYGSSMQSGFGGNNMGFGFGFPFGR